MGGIGPVCLGAATGRNAMYAEDEGAIATETSGYRSAAAGYDDEDADGASSTSSEQATASTLCYDEEGSTVMSGGDYEGGGSVCRRLYGDEGRPISDYEGEPPNRGGGDEP